jgi:hypothetical protein
MEMHPVYKMVYLYRHDKQLPKHGIGKRISNPAAVGVLLEVAQASDSKRSVQG